MRGRGNEEEGGTKSCSVRVINGTGFTEPDGLVREPDDEKSKGGFLQYNFYNDINKTTLF